MRRATLVSVLLSPFVALVAATLFAAAVNVYRPAAPNRTDPGALGLKFQSVAFRSKDGISLAGWLIPACTPGTPRGAVLVCHGVGANRSDVLPRARFLCAAGYTCFLFDFRDHGESAGNKVSYGLYEKWDVRAALDELVRAAPGLPVAVMAQSMGAGTVVLASGQLPEARAFILDSSFATLWEMARENFKHFPPWVAVPFQYLVSLWGSLMIGASIFDVSPQAVVQDLAPRPVLFIHGAADNFIPPEHTVRLHGLYRGTKELYLVAGAQHVASHTVAGAAFEMRVLAFLERSLPRVP